GNAISTIDNFAAAHGGNTPVFVFVDVGGSFNNDTECVNGPRGNVADHLTKDVPPFVVSTFGGDAAAWTTFDPTTVITKHGPYHGVSGWFAISSDAPQQHKGGFGNPSGTGLGGQDAAGMPHDQTEAANSLCTLGQANGIACAVVASPGKHDWPF